MSDVYLDVLVLHVLRLEHNPVTGLHTNRELASIWTVALIDFCKGEVYLLKALLSSRLEMAPLPCNGRENLKSASRPLGGCVPSKRVAPLTDLRAMRACATRRVAYVLRRSRGAVQ
jgi:hypothetical protein